MEHQLQPEAASSEEIEGWITWFIELEGHDFFIEVDEVFLKDPFNLYGLKQKIANYNEALNMIVADESPDTDDFNSEEFMETYQSAMDLYGLIHARYITTPTGMSVMKEKFLLGDFGNCPRHLCKK